MALRALAGRDVLASETLARFSALAGGVLLAVAVTGSFMAWRVVGSWAGLVETAYGWLLLTKVAIALVVAGAGGWNRWRVLPAVQAATGFGDRERAAATVTRTVRVEAVLLMALLAVVRLPRQPVAATGAAVPRRPAPRGSVPRRPGDLRVLAVMDPRRTGANTLLVQVQDAAGEPYDPPRNPVVSVSTEGLDIGEVVLVPVGAGTYRGEVVVSRRGHVGGAGQPPAEPLREPRDDGQARRLTLIRARVRR